MRTALRQLCVGGDLHPLHTSAFEQVQVVTQHTLPRYDTTIAQLAQSIATSFVVHEDKGGDFMATGFTKTATGGSVKKLMRPPVSLEGEDIVLLATEHGYLKQRELEEAVLETHAANAFYRACNKDNGVRIQTSVLISACRTDVNGRRLPGTLKHYLVQTPAQVETEQELREDVAKVTQQWEQWFNTQWVYGVMHFFYTRLQSISYSAELPAYDWNYGRRMLEWGHANGLVHCDIKSRNLCVTTPPAQSSDLPKVVLIDFGYAQLFGWQNRSFDLYYDGMALGTLIPFDIGFYLRQHFDHSTDHVDCANAIDLPSQLWEGLSRYKKFEIAKLYDLACYHAAEKRQERDRCFYGSTVLHRYHGACVDLSELKQTAKTAETERKRALLEIDVNKHGSARDQLFAANKTFFLQECELDIDMRMRDILQQQGTATVNRWRPVVTVFQWIYTLLFRRAPGLTLSADDSKPVRGSRRVRLPDSP